MPYGLDEFETNGFAVIPDALTPEQVDRFNTVMTGDGADSWMSRAQQGRVQTVDIQLRHPDFDEIMDRNSIIDDISRLLDNKACIEEFSIMSRPPVNGEPESTGWHRDFARNDGAPLGLSALSLVYYLTDVGDSDHCFSIVPETHDRLYRQPPNEHQPEEEVDIKGPAGTALLFHTSCVHGGKLKANSRERRTIHMYYGFSDHTPISAHSHIPSRLKKNPNPDLNDSFYQYADK